MMARKTLFGINERGWKTIDALSITLILATTIADTAGKSKNKKFKKIKNLGMSKSKYDRTRQVSNGLLIFVLARNAFDAFEELDVIVKRDAVFPGRGILTDTARTALVKARFGGVPPVRNVF